ncbi:MAG: glycosyl transferase family 1 [Desulfovibrio sp.]|nr:glycosyl transferase family 1 [Desulfovibrio sp.]
MRIAFVGLRSLGACSGGVERHVEELATRMVQLGHRVTVYCRTRYNMHGSEEYQGVRLINVPAIYTKHLEALSHTALCMPAVLTGYDLVHVHALGPSLLSWVPRLAGRRVVVTVHGLDFLRGKWGLAASLTLRLGAWTAAHCPNRTIVVSRQLQQYFAQHQGTTTTYITNGVNSPCRRPLDQLKRFGLSEKGYLLFLGRLVPEKGVHHLIEAFQLLSTDLRLVIVGGSSHSDEYVDALRRMSGHDPRIIFTGPLFDIDKDEAFSNAKAFVMPSLLEGMPLVLLEAMSYGCPTLVSDIPECLEVLPASGPATARTFPHGDSAALARSLGAMLAQTDLEEMGARGRTHILAHYNWDAITQDTLDVYSKVL